MVKLKIKKSKKFIIISHDDFEHILNCLANQKFIPYPTSNKIAQQNQKCIDSCYSQCRDALNGKENL